MKYGKNKPSKILTWITKKLMDYSIKKMIKGARKDYAFRKLLRNFEAIIQIFTEDRLIERFIVFEGGGKVIFVEGEALEPDATVIYRSVRDLFSFIRSYGDIYEGLLENRYRIRGNFAVLLKYRLLSNYFNPKHKKIEDLKKKIIASF